jgi:hypothetical protein
MTDELTRSPPRRVVPAAQQDDPEEVRRRQQRERLDAHIGNRVLDSLGRPADLYRVQVRHLWGDSYRVNVLVGVDATAARVAHSYFLSVDGDGNVAASAPTIKRRY